MFSMHMRRVLTPAAGVIGGIAVVGRRHEFERRLRQDFPSCGHSVSSAQSVRCDSASSTQSVHCDSVAITPSVGQFTSFGTYIFDCDGVIWGIAESDTKSSIATINRLIKLGKRVLFVTNNANKSREAFIQELERRGIDFQGKTLEEKLKLMVSASFTTAHYLKEHGLNRPFVITSAVGILDELRRAGITEYFATINDDGSTVSEFESHLMKGGPANSKFPEIKDIIRAHPRIDSIVVSWDLGLTARKIATAINYIKWYEDLYGDKLGYRPMPIIACSGDTGGVLGTEEFNGERLKLRAIGNGPMAEIITRSFDPPREWIDCGKPSDALLWLMRRVYGVDASDTLMVGDTLQTDIVFGNRGGMSTLLVLTGVTTQNDLESALIGGNPMRRPVYVLPKLVTLHEQGQL